MGLKEHEKKSTPPWGTWEVLVAEPTYKVKRITVLPGHRMSYQKHARRSEHWFIVQGKAWITMDGQERELSPGQSVDIPCQTPHRIKNAGPDLLVFVEVQTGNYFGEEDNHRLHDDYGRA